MYCILLRRNIKSEQIFRDTWKYLEHLWNDIQCTHARTHARTHTHAIYIAKLKLLNVLRAHFS